jgi:hypothetical protein
VGARSQRRELLLRLAEKRNRYQDADAGFVAGLRRMQEEGIKRDFKASEIERLRLYDEIMRPVKDHYDKCEREFFVGFAELVSIKPDRAEDFARGVGRLLTEARVDGVSRMETPHPHQPHTLTRAEAALRTALNAMAALSLEERAHIGEVLWLQDDTKKIDEYINALSRLANAVATAVGTGSIAPTDDELDVNRANWALLHFIRKLWRVTHEFGGSLNYSRKHGVGLGSLMTTLRLLQPLLPKGMLDNPPYAAIEALVREEKKRSTRSATGE